MKGASKRVSRCVRGRGMGRQRKHANEHVRGSTYSCARRRTSGGVRRCRLFGCMRSHVRRMPLGTRRGIGGKGRDARTVPVQRGFRGHRRVPRGPCGL